MNRSMAALAVLLLAPLGACASTDHDGYAVLDEAYDGACLPPGCRIVDAPPPYAPQYAEAPAYAPAPSYPPAPYAPAYDYPPNDEQRSAPPCSVACIAYREPPYPGPDYRRDWSAYDDAVYPPPYGYTYGSANGYGYGYSYPAPRYGGTQYYPGIWSGYRRPR
jgi:hypothetical protein